jgi:large subunit ribosomal protein L10
MRQDHQTIINAFSEKVKTAQSVFISGYSGMNEKEVTQLRKELRTYSAEHRVLKNRYFKCILSKIGIPSQDHLKPVLKGNTAFTIGGSDIVAVAKSLLRFARDHEKLEIKGALVQGRVLNPEQIKNLAWLPSREELIEKTVQTIAAPLSNLVYVLKANLNKLAGVIQAIKEKKEGS